MTDSKVRNEDLFTQEWLAATRRLVVPRCLTVAAIAHVPTQYMIEDDQSKPHGNANVERYVGVLRLACQ